MILNLYEKEKIEKYTLKKLEINDFLCLLDRNIHLDIFSKNTQKIKGDSYGKNNNDKKQ